MGDLSENAGDWECAFVYWLRAGLHWAAAAVARGSRAARRSLLIGPGQRTHCIHEQYRLPSFRGLSKVRTDVHLRI